jgi:sporulation-control protein spo0M
MTISLRTELSVARTVGGPDCRWPDLSVARSVDKGDLDEVVIHPLPVRQQILAAFDRLGFRLRPRSHDHAAQTSSTGTG